MSITILLCDDHAVVRDGLRALLENQADMKVIGTAANGLEAVSAAKQLQPDVVVLDISMPEMNGIEATQRICETLPQPKVLILSMHSSSEHVYRALQAGARGYLLKDSAGTLLVDAVRTVYAGRRYLGDSIKETVVSGYLGEIRHLSPLEALSRREREVLQFIVEGHTNGETAKKLLSCRSRRSRPIAAA